MTDTPSSHTDNQSNSSPLHVPVLLEPVLQYLSPSVGQSYLDLTAGYGGHARKVLEATGRPDKAVLVDRDSNAIVQLQKVFGANQKRAQQPEILHMDFLQAAQKLAADPKHRRFDMILADLGVSSPHLDDVTRGFAIAADGPLDMRMDQTQLLTADTIVNTYAADELAGILRRYGEEPKAQAIAQKIIQNRPIHSTTHLAEIVARAWPGHSRVHPATRTFQALRIAVNDELQLIERSLPLWIDLLAPQGRLAVISFHSLEDRLVKQAFHEAGGDRYDAELTVLTKKPVMADDTENVFNPRARSAKLRVAVKNQNS